MSPIVRQRESQIGSDNPNPLLLLDMPDVQEIVSEKQRVASASESPYMEIRYSANHLMSPFICPELIAKSWLQAKLSLTHEESPYDLNFERDPGRARSGDSSFVVRHRQKYARHRLFKDLIARSERKVQRLGHDHSQRETRQNGLEAYGLNDNLRHASPAVNLDNYDLFEDYSGPHRASGWRSKRPNYHRRGGMISRTSLPFIATTATLLVPCAAVAYSRTGWLSCARVSGTISTSAAVSLIPLQTEPDVDMLRWITRLLWAVTYAVLLMSLYKSISRHQQLYLFCSLMLSAHFLAGFTQIGTVATEGVATFGPFATTICAALVSLPFTYWPSNAPSGSLELSGIPTPTTTVHSDYRRISSQAHDGDLGVRGAVSGVLGIVV